MRISIRAASACAMLLIVLSATPPLLGLQHEIPIIEDYVSASLEAGTTGIVGEPQADPSHETVEQIPAEGEPEPEVAEREEVPMSDGSEGANEEPSSEVQDPSSEGLTAAAPDPCEVRRQGKEPWLDHLRREVFESVCESAAWFDGFFGSRRFDEEARRTHGRVGLHLIYDEYDGFDVDGLFKVRVDFPNLDNRVNAFLGREDRENFLTGAEERLDFLPTFFEREGDEEWLLGLGYRPVGGDRSSLDFDVGVEVETPIDPFARVRYRYFWLLGSESLLRAQQSVYWTQQRDLGFSSRVDYERPVGTRSLARAAARFSHDSETEGVDWDGGVTLYHGFSNDRALSWFVGVDGETGRDVPIESYGSRVTYRQRMLREWFFGEVITGVTWPRERLDETREMAWHLGFGFEIQFSGEDLFGSRDQ